MSTATSAALRGTLQDFGAEEILQFLAGTKQSGALVLTGDSNATLWFDQGEIYNADATTSVPLSDELLAGLDQAELDRLVESRTVDAVFELTVTSAADFEFRGGEQHPLAGGRRHSVESLIAASRERLERWREVATVLPSIAVIVTLADDVPSDAPDIVLSPSEWRVVAHLDGRRSIADITRLLGASAFDVCATLHRLVTAGAAKVVDAG